MNNTLLKITGRAIKQLSLISCNGFYTRLYIKSGGCNGIVWNLEHVKTLDKHDSIVNKHLTIEKSSLFHVLGSTLDYKQTLSGNYFTLVNEIKNSCGCGKSFAL